MVASAVEHTLGSLLGRTDRWLRAWRLILSGINMPGGGGSEEALILSSDAPTGYGALGYNDASAHDYAAGLRITFQVNQMARGVPNTAEITIYNLEDNFAANLIREDSYVILQAGYEWGNAGTIFTGTIKAYKKGHENVTDSYIKIYAADGDTAINEATANKSFKADTPTQDIHDYYQKQLKLKGVDKGYVDNGAVVIPAKIRDSVAYGLVADELKDFSRQNGALWHVLDQKYHFARPDSYEPGAIIELTEQSGLIGFPEQTENGLNITCLIDSAIRLRQRIMINNKLVNQYLLPGNEQARSQYFTINYPAYSTFRTYANLSNDGVYCPWQINYEGDSRGGPWYMHMVCLTVDTTKDKGIGSLLGGLLRPRW